MCQVILPEEPFLDNRENPPQQLAFFMEASKVKFSYHLFLPLFREMPQLLSIMFQTYSHVY